MDPVTDDLDWEMFGADLADGIVVSILDSFVLELLVLDFSMVQSVFEELDKHLPPHEERGQQITGKEEYFKDILFAAQTQTQESSDKISPQRKDQVQESGEKGKCNENTVSLLQRKIKTSLGKRLAQPEDHLQQGLDEDSSQDIVSLSRTTLQETDDQTSPKHADEVQESIGKKIISSALIKLCQSEETGLDTQSNGIGKIIDKTLVHSSCWLFQILKTIPHSPRSSCVVVNKTAMYRPRRQVDCLITYWGVFVCWLCQTWTKKKFSKRAKGYHLKMKTTL